MDSDYLGEIRMFAGDFEPEGWKFCNGQILDISNYPDLFEVIKNMYGGDGITNFALPDLGGRIPIGSGSTTLQQSLYSQTDMGTKIFTYKRGEQGGNNSTTLTKDQIPAHSHEAKLSYGQGESDETNPSKGFLTYTKYPVDLYSNEGVETEGQFLSGIECGETGSKDPQPFNITGPSLGINYIIAITSTPSEKKSNPNAKAALAEIRLYAGDKAPEGWMFCEGQKLQISKRSVTFSLIGTMYGGDGRTSFLLPNFIGVTCIGYGEGSGTNSVSGLIGNRRLTPDRLLTSANLPTHTHEMGIQVSTMDAEESSPTGYLAFGNFYLNEKHSSTERGYPSETVQVDSTEICLMQPYLGVKYIICISAGVFPARNF